MNERKSRARRPKSTEPSLFHEDDAPHGDKPRRLVLTSNFTVGPLFARGCLLGVDVSAGERTTFMTLRYADGAIPTPWVDELLASARNVIPIAVQLRTGRDLRRIQVAATDLRVDAVCLSDVAALLFRDQKELSRFSTLELDNYSIESTRLRLRVDAAAFEAAPGAGATELNPFTRGAAPTETSTDLGREPSENVRSVIRRADALVGLLAYLLTSSPGRQVWMHGVRSILQRTPKWSDDSTWPEKLAVATLGMTEPVTDVDRALLIATVEVISALPVEDGWPAERVLADIRKIALGYAAGASSAISRDIELWADRASEVLNARTEPQSLNDDSHVAQRAVLLLLLRGDVEAVRSGMRASTGRLRPGPQVAGLASALAALRAGLRALPSWCKSGPTGEASGRLVTYLGDLFAGLLAADARSLFPKSVAIPALEYRRVKTLQGEWVASVEGREISRIPATFDTGLERLLSMGRDLGFDFVEHGETGLETEVVQADGTQRPVFVKVLKGHVQGGAIVRFSSPTLEVKGVKSRPRLPKEFLFKLLIRNAEPDMNCRFAIDEEEGLVVVLVDQLLGTLDEQEFKQHVHHVAEVASKFELSRGVPGDVS